ncbi:hypothetical protein DWX89_02995 [Coprobacillus sp. AF21-8LB]|nr:hypothetical protein DWX89_02995 [Coprobacillus sp. AF21-8LB]
MSQFDELRSLLLEWGEDKYLPLKKKISYLENENYRLRMQNQRIHERNKRLSMIVKKRREEANNENRQRNCSM